MTKIATDPSLSIALIEKARVRRQDFNWQKTSERLWNSIEKALDSNA
jgi:hypothetical protein